MKLKPHHITVDANGVPKLKARFKRTKHRGYQPGAFGKPSK